MFMVVFLGLFLSWEQQQLGELNLVTIHPVGKWLSVCASHDVDKRKKTTQVSYGCAARFQFETLLECIKANSFMAN